MRWAGSDTRVRSGAWLHTSGWRGARALRPSDGLNARFPVFTQLNPPLPVLVTDKGAGLAFAVIDYGVEHNLIWVTALDGSGEIWSVRKVLSQIDSSTSSMYSLASSTASSSPR